MTGNEDYPTFAVRSPQLRQRKHGETWGNMGKHGETWGNMGKHGETAFFRGVVAFEIAVWSNFCMKSLRNYQKTFFRENRYGTRFESRSLRS